MDLVTLVVTILLEGGFLNDRDRVFVYSRGDKYKVTVILKPDLRIEFDNMNVPTDCPEDIIIQFLDEAETKVLSKLEKEYTGG